MQGTQKTLEGSAHPDRNVQLELINARVESFQARQAPVFSEDTKKEELIGEFKHDSREWQPKGDPVPERVHDFIDSALGKVLPYVVYDLTRNQGWVSVGVDHETPAFAVRSIAQCWRSMGKRAYPEAKALLITADGGVSNASCHRHQSIRRTNG